MNDVVPAPRPPALSLINYDLSAYQKGKAVLIRNVFMKAENYFLYELWQKMGDDMFFQMLHKYYETYRFKLATTQDFFNDCAVLPE